MACRERPRARHPAHHRLGLVTTPELNGGMRTGRRRRWRGDGRSGAGAPQKRSIRPGQSEPTSWGIDSVGPVDVAYDERKFAEMLLYIAGRLRGDRAGGATKLNKVLFFAEFTHLRRHHQVISGCEFQKLEHGPAPRPLLPVRRSLIEAGDAEMLTEDFLGRPQQRLVPTRAADTSSFSEDELRSIDDVLEQLAGMTGTQVSELSHEEPGWRLTKIGETIPFSTAFLDFPQVPTPTTARLADEAAARYGFASRG